MIQQEKITREVNMYQAFKNEWNGRKIDFDHVYAYQCVDLILQYCYENGVNQVWGNAIDYANRPSPNFVAHFNRVGDLQRGDIVVLYGLAGNPYGHIGILDAFDATNVRLLEQNGVGSGTGTGRDAIGVWRNIPRSRIAAIWRLKGANPPPAPAPARSTVTLRDQRWTLYRVGSGLRPGTSDVLAILSPAYYGGLTYKIEGWVGDCAVIIQTQMFGRGVVWVKGTSAEIR